MRMRPRQVSAPERRSCHLRRPGTEKQTRSDRDRLYVPVTERPVTIDFMVLQLTFLLSGPLFAPFDGCTETDVMNSSFACQRIPICQCTRRLPSCPMNTTYHWEK